MSEQFKAYLGDAVYASWDGMHIVLTAENGQRVMQRICLGSNEWVNLLRYHTRLEKWIEQQQTPEPP